MAIVTALLFGGRVAAAPLALGNFPFVYTDEFVAQGDTLWFAARPTLDATQLWRSNGRPGDTLHVGTVPGRAELLTVMQSLVLLDTVTPSGPALYASDGATVVQVASVRPTVHATMMGGVAYFLVGQHRNEALTPDQFGLWRSDGTPEGTFRVAAVPVASYEDLFVLGNTIHFTADREPWVSDGTTAGTHASADVLPVLGWAFDDRQVRSTFDLVQNVMTVSIEDDDAYAVLHTHPLRPKQNDGGVFQIARAGARFIWTAYDDAGEWRIWRSDGTVADTATVATIANRPTCVVMQGPFAPRQICAHTSNRLTPFGAAALFTDGTELWRTDGTPDGTSLVAALPISYVSNIAPAGDTAWLFDDRDGTVIRSDGTHAGTRTVGTIERLVRIVALETWVALVARPDTTMRPENMLTAALFADRSSCGTEASTAARLRCKLETLDDELYCGDARFAAPPPTPSEQRALDRALARLDAGRRLGRRLSKRTEKRFRRLARLVEKQTQDPECAARLVRILDERRGAIAAAR